MPYSTSMRERQQRAAQVEKQGRPLFQEPPEDRELLTGALLLNWNGAAGIEAPEVGAAYRAAAERLLDAAISENASWEALYPVLFCYRHALEVTLKSMLLTPAKNHRLPEIWATVQSRVEGRYQPDQVAWLTDRILEFDRVDPSSTAFRYHDAVPSRRGAELWVDFHHLRATMTFVFSALNRIQLDGMMLRQPVRDAERGSPL